MSEHRTLRTTARRLDLTRHLGSGLRLLARFGTIGALAFVVDVGVFNLLRQLTELGPLTCKTISVVLATTVAYAGNRSWTFGHRGDQRSVTASYVLFFVANGLALLISLVCLGFTYYVLGLTSTLAENVSSNVVGVGLGTLFRFWAYARWVFPDAEAPAEDPAVDGAGPAHPTPPAAPGPSERHAA